tara:strand:- start:415 stop:1587 length:1173 start_codon:yes stop_codon:yes gene_type:complete
MAKDPKSRFNNQRYEVTIFENDIDDNAVLEADRFRRLTDSNQGLGPNGEIKNKNYPAYYAATDSIANNHEAVISFQHVPSGEDVYFKAFITTFSDSLAPSYTEETVFGRTDPIYTFKNTTRNISLNWKVPAASVSEAYENLGKAQTLAQFVYPNYTDLGSANTIDALTISQTPLVRLKVMNLLTNISNDGEKNEADLGDSGFTASGLKQYKSNSDSSRGALGVIKSMTIVHNLENHDIGVLYVDKNTVLPKLIEINLSFDVIHEDTLGWQNDSFTNKGFPYGVKLEGEVDMDAISRINTFEQETNRRQAKRDKKEEREQDIANAKARYGTFGGRARFKKDEKRLNRLNKKGELNERQQAKRDYLEDARNGVSNPDDKGKVEFKNLDEFVS